MSNAAQKCRNWLTTNTWTDEEAREHIDQASDEKYRPLVEAVELYIKANGSHDCAERYNQLREALRKVKEG